jgi:hypothetical protein
MGKGGTWVVDTIERIEGYYEVQEVEFGRVYRWCPECVVAECDCGERLSLTGSTTICSCGVEHHGATVGEEPGVGQLKDKALHPWRYVRDSEDAGIPF